MAAKIIAMSTITSHWNIRVPEIIVELLKKDQEEQIWVKWSLLHRALILTRKDKENTKGEFISSGRIRNYEGFSQLTIPSDIRKLLDVGIGDDILWIIDEYSDIMMKDTILSPGCVTEDKAILMNMSTFSPSVTRIPKDIREYLKVNVGDRVAFLRSDNNIIIEKYDEKNIPPNFISQIKITPSDEIYIHSQVRWLLDLEDLVLWILDNSNGNIVLKNAILADICAEIVR